MRKDYPHLVRIALWALILRHGHCISDTRFGDVTIALDDAKHKGGVWNEDQIVERVREHDEESRKNRPEHLQDKKNTHVFKVSLPRSKGTYANEFVIPNIQATNAVTYDRATDTVRLIFW